MSLPAELSYRAFINGVPTGEEIVLSPNQLLGVAPSGNALTGLGVGTNLTIVGGNLNASGGGGAVSQHVVFASAPPAGSGLTAAALNYNPVTKVGTDDTVVLQAMIAFVSAIGGHLVIDGKTLVSDVLYNASTRHFTCLNHLPNVIIHGIPGGGIYCKDGSNIGVISNNGYGDYRCPYMAGMGLRNLYIFCGTQTATERNNGVTGLLAVWYQGVSGFIFDNVTIEKSSAFTATFNRYQDLYVNKYTQIAGGLNGNGDTIHLYDGVRPYVNDITCNGNDDGLAINSDEAVYIHNVNLAGHAGILGYDRYSGTFTGGTLDSNGNYNGATPTLSTTGTIVNNTNVGSTLECIIQNVRFNNHSGHNAAWNVYYSTTTVDVITRNVTGDGSGTGIHYGPQIGTNANWDLDGWHNCPGYNADSARTSGNLFNRLRINDVDEGVDMLNSLAITGTAQSGDYFGASSLATSEIGVIYVASDGNDSTGAVGDGIAPIKPFVTAQAAFNAAATAGVPTITRFGVGSFGDVDIAFDLVWIIEGQGWANSSIGNINSTQPDQIAITSVAKSVMVNNINFHGNEITMNIKQCRIGFMNVVSGTTSLVDQCDIDTLVINFGDTNTDFVFSNCRIISATDSSSGQFTDLCRDGGNVVANPLTGIGASVGGALTTNSVNCPPF